MKAMQVNGVSQGPMLVETALSKPQPGEGELLVRVRAAGVTPDGARLVSHHPQ